MTVIYCSVGIAENVTQSPCYICTVYLTVVSVVRKM